MRHVRRIHGSKIVPAPSSKSRIATLLAAKGNSTAGALLSSNAGLHSNLSQTGINSTALGATDSLSQNLSSEFSNRLTVTHSHSATATLNSIDTNHTADGQSHTNLAQSVRPNQTLVTNALANSSSSNSNSPISSTKTSTTSSSSGKGRSRKQTSKDREYDPEKHCGVRIGGMKPCTRSLTCKTHAVSLRRSVEGRSKPFDQLLADHRNNAKDSHHKHANNRQVIVLIRLVCHQLRVETRY